MYVCLLAYVFLSPSENVLKRVLSRKTIRGIGRISYGMYLFHVPIMMIMVRYIYDLDLGYWLSHFIVLVGGSALSFGLAYLSYNHFEKRFLRIKEKYAPLQS